MDLFKKDKNESKEEVKENGKEMWKQNKARGEQDESFHFGETCAVFALFLSCIDECNSRAVNFKIGFYNTHDLRLTDCKSACFK